MISLCLTSWNRDSMTFDSFRNVLNDDRISEIVIVDDHSEDVFYNNLVFMCNGLDKVKIYRNEVNLGCYFNKRRSVELATNDWVILFDSDNILKRDYLNAIDHAKDWQPHMLYQPEFARPHFDFTKFAGSVINRDNVKGYLRQQHFTTMLNAMNFFINRDEFLKIPVRDKDPMTADSIYFNYLWLKAGNKIYVTPDMQYVHKVNDHEGQEMSHYKKFNHLTGNFYNEVERLLREL